MTMMSNDSKVILMLCGRLGNGTDVEPLKLSEYTRIVRWLISNQMRPADLLEPEIANSAAASANLPAARLASLLKRGVQLGFAVESWNRSNIWVITRSDPEYPARYRTHLKDKAPPILFGVGNRSLLQGGGLAIVGSRNIDREAEDFTSDVAAWCARGGMPVISGGARGVDQIAMKAALDDGGCVVGILAEHLLKNSVSQEARKALAAERLLLISPYHPEVRFDVGNAMGRNKLIYAMADYGLVVSADHDKGGTWAGAEEELKRNPARPVFVRMNGTVPTGNLKLVKLGAVPFPDHRCNTAPATMLQDALSSQTETPADDLFSYTPKAVQKVSLVAEPSAPVQTETRKELIPSETRHPVSIYDAVLPVIVAALEKPTTVDDLAVGLDVAKGQLQIWLKKAVDERKIKKLAKPVRYKKT